MSDELILQLIQERAAYWSNAGYRGCDVYLRLSTDPQIPENLPPGVVAAIMGVKADALKFRRRKKMRPAYLRLSATLIAYPKRDFFPMLAESYVSHSTA